MTCRVIWNWTSTDELQRIYNRALDKEAVVNATKRIGLELSAIPHDAGESREQGRRILFKFPQVVWYRVDDRMKDVIIVRVHGNLPK